MSVSVKTTKLIEEHLRSIFPDTECRRSYIPCLDPEELDDGKITLCVNPVGREADNYTQGGMQKHELEIDIWINAKLTHRNDESDAFTAEVDELIAFTEKVYAAFLKKIVKNAENFRAAFDQPEHIVLCDYSAIQERNCFYSIVRVNAQIFTKPETQP